MDSQVQSKRCQVQFIRSLLILHGRCYLHMSWYTSFYKHLLATRVELIATVYVPYRRSVPYICRPGFLLGGQPPWEALTLRTAHQHTIIFGPDVDRATGFIGPDLFVTLKRALTVNHEDFRSRW